MFRPVLFGLLFSLSSSVWAQPSDEAAIVRVHILTRVSTATVTLEAKDGPVAIHLDRSRVPVTTLALGSVATFERDGSRVQVRFPGGQAQATVAEAVPGDGHRLGLRSGTTSRTYHGAMALLPSPTRRASLRLINHVPLEAYVSSVVASEYPFTEIEGVKAQAVLARTYALRAVDPSQPFDVTDDTGSQVYRGADAVTAVARTATEQTHGQVLRYGGQYVEATYYSSSGGHTANNEDVWRGSPIPYLRGKPDTYDADAPDYRWSTSANAAGTLRALSNRYGGRVTGFEIADRSPEGRVTRVRLLGGRTREISGNEFRSTVNGTFGVRTVRSTHFTVVRRGDRYVFDGRGFGHGVGMSQYGARGRARAGQSYEAILAFYFSGTQLSTIRPQLASAPPASAEPTRLTLSDFQASGTDRQNAGPRAQASHWRGNTETDEPARRTAW